MKNKKINEIKNFILFIKKELNIKNLPEIYLVNNRKNLKTLASYDYSNSPQKIFVYTKKRYLPDILRSIAHELVHHKQFENNKLNGKIQDIGGEIEDEANAVAGRLVKKYSYQNPIIYNLDQ